MTKKATKKAAKRRKGYVVTSDICVHGKRGDWVPAAAVENPRALIRAGHLEPKDK